MANVIYVAYTTKYGECCCCLEKGEYRNLTEQYYWNALPEIYEVLFKTTFEIEINYPEDTKLICESCIVKLREACNFRTMVERSQQSLGENVNWQPESYKEEEEPFDLFEEEDDKSMVTGETLIDELMPTITPPAYRDHQYIANDHFGQEKEIGIERVTSGNNIEQVFIADQVVTSDPVIFSPGNNHTGSPAYHQLSQNKSSLQHIIKKAKKSYSCDKCPYKTFYKNSYITHLYKHPGENIFSCDVCEYKTFAEVHLEVHMRTYAHYVEKPLSCDSCQYQCKTRKSLRYHMANHTGDKPFSCDICEYRTARGSDLKAHYTKHSNEKPFKCDVCQFQTKTRRLLRVHMVTHKEKTFKCNICDHRTVTNEYLKSHLLVHTKERPVFLCDKCSFQTARKVSLKKHLLIHSDEKPFSCDHCEYKYNRIDYLNSHLRTHSAEKPLACDNCEYRTARKGNLKRHMLRHQGKTISLRRVNFKSKHTNA